MLRKHATDPLPQQTEELSSSAAAWIAPLSLPDFLSVTWSEEGLESYVNQLRLATLAASTDW